MNDNITLRGAISVYAVDHLTDARYRVFEKHNMVVDMGLTILCQLLGPGGPSAQSQVDNAIGFIRLGGRVSGSGDTAAETAPAADQIGLLGTVVASLPVTTTVYPDAASVEFTASLAASEGNGYDIQELGLVTSATPPRLFARQVVVDGSGVPAALVKTDAMSFDVTWRVTFERAAGG